MAKKKKQVASAAIERESGKNTKQKSQPDYSQHNPSWRFSGVDKSGPFAWPQNSNDELAIIQKLHNFDSMTWSIIKGTDHHFLSPQKLSKDALNRLSTIQRDDSIDNLFSFHINGRIRIICIVTENVAQLLWYDTDHLVSPSKLKHT